MRTDIGNNRSIAVRNGEHGKARIIALAFILAIVVAAGWLYAGRRKQGGTVESTPASTTQPVKQTVPQLLAKRGRLSSPAFSPTGNILGVVGDEKTVYLVDVPSVSIIQEISDGCCSVSSIAFSADASRIALGLNSAEGPRLRVLGIRQGKYLDTVREIRQEGSLVHFVEFSHDGKQLLSEIDSDAIFWNIETGAESKRFEAGVNGICAVSVDEATLITAGSNANEVAFWDVASGTQKHNLPGHTEGLIAVAISQDGSVGASGGYDATVRIWDTQSGTAKHILKHNGSDQVNAVVFAPAGNVIATAGSTVRVWNVLSGNRERQFPVDRIRSLAFSFDGKLLAGTSFDGGLYLWPLQ